MNKQLKSEVFIFRYDPHSSFENLFKEFWAAVDEKIEVAEPHVVRSSSIEALSTNMTKNRLLIFATLGGKPIRTTLCTLARRQFIISVRNYSLKIYVLIDF